MGTFDDALHTTSAGWGSYCRRSWKGSLGVGLGLCAGAALGGGVDPGLEVVHVRGRRLLGRQGALLQPRLADQLGRGRPPHRHRGRHAQVAVQGNLRKPTGANQ